MGSCAEGLIHTLDCNLKHTHVYIHNPKLGCVSGVCKVSASKRPLLFPLSSHQFLQPVSKNVSNAELLKEHTGSASVGFSVLEIPEPLRKCRDCRGVGETPQLMD